MAMVPAIDLPAAARNIAGRTEGWSDVAPVALPMSELVGRGIKPMVQGEAERIKTLIDPSIDSSRLAVIH
jgi:(R,R)-butanediol dehydrogenase / meso-butanediol dehydrogenase / diacetyl reductase